ncbi:beta-1,3-glucanase family protein [Actinomadura sp. DC4]|uniref:beta-1,3-glucanase family protein n=1 Tax=Actinomadura sp. DC4 TaxID=3055069 RepID=UPI0025B0803D|nr:beta-1,3-glucanase family protein [Actinomadura sp. DC4]MDN3356452.1 beta-1,3-glucanase family protein [Actinomadura sp. DC4]
MVTRRSFLAAAGAAALTVPFGHDLLGKPASATPATCGLTLANHGPTPVNAYITGREQGTGRLMLLRADSTPYYLENPSAPQTPLPVDCSIPVGAGGEANLTLRQMYAARLYFVKNDKLDFYVNPGPGLVEPAFANPSDANYGRTWSFAEFTYNTSQLFANISYVDLLTALPIGLALVGDSTHTVAAAPAGAVDAVADALVAQSQADGRPWDKLVIRDGGGVLRVIAPQDHMASDSGAFASYWDGYVGQVWDKYAGTDLRVDLQGGRGVRTGRVSGGVLTFDDGSTFARPAAKDIFTCNDGPFANNPADSDSKKGLLARIAAAFNRSTILSSADQPNGTLESDYYKATTTNHWARIVHAHTPIGYAFPYDDVCPDGQPDVSGAAADGNPQRLTVDVG